MKTIIWCAFMIAMLLVSSAAFGEIVHNGGYDDDYGGGGGADGGWSWSSVAASAQGDNTLSWGYASGWETWYTTEYAYCYWECSPYLYGETHIWFHDVENCYCWAYGEVNCYSPSPYTKEYEGWIIIDQDDYEGKTHVMKEFGEFEDFHQDAYYIDAYEGVNVDHLIGFHGVITAGSDDYTYSHICGHTFCYMEEIEY